MDMTMKEQFAKDGFVVLKQLFTLDEVRMLKEEAAAVVARHDVGKHGVHVGMAAESDVFKEAAAKPALASVLKEVIGEHVVFLSDKIVFKNATTDFGSPWHQDHAYWYGSSKFSVWIALDEANRDNGCLRVMPGSHLLGKLNHDIGGSEEEGFVNRMFESRLDLSQAIDVPAAPGDAIFFSDLLLHASHANITGRDRWALISTYKDGTLEDPAYSWAKAAFAL